MLVGYLFWANDFGTKYRFVQIELAIKFFNRFWTTVHINDCVDTFGLLVDFEGHTTTAPNVELVDFATTVFDDLEICLKAWCDCAFFLFRIENDHEFIMTHTLTPPPLD